MNNWSELALNIFNILSPLLAALVGWLGLQLNKWIKQKVENEAAEGVLIRLSDSILTAVKMVNQTLKDDLVKAKADGKITQEEKDHLKAQVIIKLKSEYGGIEGLSKALKVLGLDGEGAVMGWISDKIEASIHDTKIAAKAAGAGNPS